MGKRPGQKGMCRTYKFQVSKQPFFLHVYLGCFAVFEQGPVGGIEDVTNQKEDDRRQEEVEEVETLVLVVCLLKYFHVEVKYYSSNI